MIEERNILLRMWNKVAKEMCYDPIINGSNGNVLITEYGNIVASLSRECYILMQFTGLYDIDGVKIYEGDILEDPTADFASGEADRCVVNYYDKYARFGLEFYSIYGGEGYTGFTQHIHQWIKGHRVIGNIYENRDLLKK